VIVAAAVVWYSEEAFDFLFRIRWR